MRQRISIKVNCWTYFDNNSNMNKKTAEEVEEARPFTEF